MIVYTAVFGEFDSVPPLPDGINGVCYSDVTEPIRRGGWEFVPAVYKDENPRLRSRHHKCMAHALFPGETTLWIDGNVQISSLPDEHEFAAYHHRNINSAREELAHIGTCRRWPSKADERRGHEQIFRYTKAGFPDCPPHLETGYIVRKDSQRNREFNALWWNEIKNGSMRDQLSCGYAMWKTHVKPFVLGSDMRADVMVKKHVLAARPTVYYFTPYDKDGIGVAYNKCCSIVPAGSWICLMDADVMLFPSTFGDIVNAAILAAPHIDVWTTMVTRINNAERTVCPGGQRDEERDLVKLYEKSVAWAASHAGDVMEAPMPALAGYFMLFRKELWDKFPFPEDVGGRRVLGIDTTWSQHLKANGCRFGIIEGLLAVHYYSLEGARGTHLKELESNAIKVLPPSNNVTTVQPAWKQRMKCKPRWGRGLKALDTTTVACIQ
jgi:glycosyltransferase involved in cell wall biosynthesis